jgi:PIN domain nuclease of toxin-antitoxin system
MAERLPSAARALVGDQESRFSPVAALELTYLHEIGRARDPVPIMLAALRRDIGLEVLDGSMAELVQAATDLSWTRDPFDRLISAHAIVTNSPLVTADETIRNNLPLAVWD